MEGINLLELVDDRGYGLTVRIYPGESTLSSDVFPGELSITTGSFGGSTELLIDQRDLSDWDVALDSLDLGHETVYWREDRAPQVILRFDDYDRLQAVVTAPTPAGMTTIVVPLTLSESWVEDHRKQLDKVRQVAHSRYSAGIA